MATNDSRADPDLDPADWEALRAQGHRMLDDMFDYLEHIRERPVWQPIPASARAAFRAALPVDPTPVAALHASFMEHVLPYTIGNPHPGFMGWVHGAGTPVGMLAEMLAGGLNANLGGRDHIPIEVERQILLWVREMFHFPDSASGIFVTGTSMANLIGLLVARNSMLGASSRRTGIVAGGKRLVAYASAAVHECIPRAMEFSGIGSESLRVIPVTDSHQIDLDALQRQIASDRASGFTPFLLIGTAGTVDTGATDDLRGLAAIAQRERFWFHVDGAYGALAMLSPDLRHLLDGIELADSIAFDFHKWGQVPYDAGYILVRDGTLQHDTFAMTPSYMRREARGAAAGSFWPCDYGPDLSRGFRALKTWFTISAYGSAALGKSIERTCEVAQYLKRRVEQDPRLELLAPVALNIVCFRYRCADADSVNARIVTKLQESGAAAPSTTLIAGRLAIRAAIVNHRTRERDVDRLLDAVIGFGEAEIAGA